VKYRRTPQEKKWESIQEGGKFLFNRTSVYLHHRVNNA
jgi:hypothetical protein